MADIATIAEKRKRKPKARHRDVILAALEERIRCVPRDDSNEFHFIRMDELLDELRRSLSGREESEES